MPSGSYIYDMAMASLRASNEGEREREKEPKTEATMYCNLTLKVAILSSLSYPIGHTDQHWHSVGRGQQKDVNTRRWGSLGDRLGGWLSLILI